MLNANSSDQNKQTNKKRQNKQKQKTTTTKSKHTHSNSMENTQQGAQDLLRTAALGSYPEQGTKSMIHLNLIKRTELKEMNEELFAKHQRFHG